ncbi:hypothetical protein DL767_003475 [Monosporascus sp. MG133]|nr:hypothetical protein DL767_003475 [Monosporascus sp. MG133]
MAGKATVSFFTILCAIGASAQQTCKLTPLDADWPSEADWSALNTTLGGSLIKTQPVASSCYPGNPFHSSQPCEIVKKEWGYSYYHASLPESIGSPLYANNSCLPPGAPGYTPTKGCEVGGAPQYVVNATTEEQVATAMAWASERNIRIIIKGTGHDLNGRSSGAYSLSIWTHNFKNLDFDAGWRSPSDNRTEAAIILGSGHDWGSASRGAAKFGRVLVGGVDETVGVGGHIQGGGHGPLSSTFGLGADQILQVRVVTTQGQILVANEAQNQDLLWAIRGGGAGQYGVVTEYVLKAHPNPGNVVSCAIEVSAAGNDIAAKEAAWRGFAVLLASVPDLMDAGLTGTGMGLASTLQNASVSNPIRKASISINFFTYNTTEEKVASLLEPVRDRILAEVGNSTVTVNLSKPSTQPDFMTFFESVNEAPSGAGTAGLMTSRLLGRKELSDIPISTLASYLQRIMVTQDPTSTSLMVIGLQGGLGPRNVPEVMRGALNPAWRSAYVHMMSYGASIDSSLSPQEALDGAAQWLEETMEPVWREWAPGSGAYMNEGNAFDCMFKEDFYGASYDRLVEIKRKYDPAESLFVLSGVGSDAWDYDLNSAADLYLVILNQSLACAVHSPTSCSIAISCAWSVPRVVSVPSFLLVTSLFVPTVVTLESLIVSAGSVIAVIVVSPQATSSFIPIPVQGHFSIVSFFSPPVFPSPPFMSLLAVLLFPQLLQFPLSLRFELLALLLDFAHPGSTHFHHRGTAGCIVVTRLADADPNLSALVIDHLLPGAKTTLTYKSKKSESLADKEVAVPSGGVLGGGSAVNMMMYSRA